MKRNAVRVFSMLLALIMLLGMAATAETERITFALNGSEGLLMDGVLTAGYDEDGCEQYAFESSLLGKWLVQFDGYDLVFGGDMMGGHYAITMQDLATALENASNILSMQDMTEAEIAMMEYMNSPAYQADVEMVSLILAGEVNRIASIAQEMGLVAIYENGDLVINVNRDNLLQMVVSYLNALASDEEVLSAFVGLEFFKVQGLGVEVNKDQIVIEILNAAEMVEQIRLNENEGIDGYLKLSVSAETGSASGEYYMAALADGVATEEVKASLIYDGANLVMNVYEKLDDAQSHISFAQTNGITAYEMNYTEGSETAKIAYVINENGLSANVTFDGEDMNGKGELTANADGVDGKWDYVNGSEFATGSIKFAPAYEEFSFKNTKSDGYEIENIDIEFKGGELNGKLAKYRGSRVVADVTVSGSDPYTVKANWADDKNACQLYATVSTNDAGCVIDGNLKINDDTAVFNYTVDQVNGAEKLVVKATGASPENTIVAEMNRVATEDAENVSAVLDYNVKGETMKFTYDCENDMVNGEIKGEFALNENGSEIRGTFFFSNTFYETTFTDGEVIVRVYSEDRSGENNLSVKSGVTAAEAANPANIVDMMLFTLDAAFENGLTFESVMNNALSGLFASANFDGQTFKLDVTADGETVSLEGKMVETETASYLEFTGIVSGLPFEARIGMKMEDDGTQVFFAEVIANGETALDAKARLIETADGLEIEISGDSIQTDEGEKLVIKLGLSMQSEQSNLLYCEVRGEAPEHLAAAYLPITVTESENGIFMNAALSLAQDGQVMEMGNVLLGYEFLAETMEHVSGERLTADMLTEMIVEILNSMSAY